ncbi:hypothetical protein CR513_30256, partial [Mucuna pruriens]
MNKEYLEYCKKEIQEYLEKELIRPSKSPWSCMGFYVMKASEIERGAPSPDTIIRPKPHNTLANIVKNSTKKEQTTGTPVPSLNPLAKISNKFTPLQYYNVIIGPSKLVSYQNPYEDQYLEKNELLPEAYDYFGEKSSIVLGYRLISFVASQAISWIMAWEYTTIQQYETVDIKTLCRQTKVKWWKKFNNNLISKSKIDE